MIEYNGTVDTKEHHEAEEHHLEASPLTSPLCRAAAPHGRGGCLGPLWTVLSNTGADKLAIIIHRQLPATAGVQQARVKTRAAKNGVKVHFCLFRDVLALDG